MRHFGFGREINTVHTRKGKLLSLWMKIWKSDFNSKLWYSPYSIVFVSFFFCSLYNLCWPHRNRYYHWLLYIYNLWIIHEQWYFNQISYCFGFGSIEYSSTGFSYWNLPISDNTFKPWACQRMWWLRNFVYTWIS